MEVERKVSRRLLLRGASAAVPAILTLQSGAALARSSNLIGVNPRNGHSDGKYNCLDFNGIDRTDRPNVYDLGSPPMAHVTRIDADSRYYKQGSSSGWGRDRDSDTEVSPARMCADGGTYIRKNRWRSTQVSVSRGGLISGTAIGSFSSGINFTDV